MSHERATQAGESAMKKVRSLRQLADRYERGAQGEAATAHALADLDAREWTVLHDVAWPGRKLANIDHVAIGPAGIFVIDSKNWKARVTTVGGVLLCGGRSQAQTTRSAAEAGVAVGELLPSVSPKHVVPVLCFTDGDVPDRVIDGVLVCSIITVVHQVSFRPSVLSPEKVQAAVSELRRALPAATEARPAPVAKPQPKKRGHRGSAAGAAGAVAAAAALFAIVNGVTDDPANPPAEQPVERNDQQDQKDQKDKAPAKKKTKQR